jgi:hypothetical protein
VSPTARIAAAVLAIGLVAYAGWLLVKPDADKPEAAEPKSAKTPRRDKPVSTKAAGAADARPRVAPVRREPGAEDNAGAAPNVALDMTPEAARMQLKVMVEDIEAKAERGETMSQAEYVHMYKRGSELAQTLASGTDPKDAGAQKDFGDLNSRFRIAISKVQPRSP